MGKVDDRIPILQLAKSRNNKSKETEIWVKKDGFKLDSRLGWKIETFWDSYKLTCDQLLDMCHTQNFLGRNQRKNLKTKTLDLKIQK